MRLLIIALALSTLFTLNSCQKENFYDGDHFFISNAGAEMPVYIKGNTESKTFILFAHGGPGSNASLVSFLPVAKELEMIMLLFIGISVGPDFLRAILIPAHLP